MCRVDGVDACSQVRWTLPPTVPAVSVVAVLDRERGHAGSGARGGHRRFALLGRGLELAHAPRSLRLRAPKDLNACCPAGPETPNTHETTALSITIVRTLVVHFLVSYMTLARFGASTRAVAVPLEKTRSGRIRGVAVAATTSRSVRQPGRQPLIAAEACSASRCSQRSCTPTRS